MLFASNFANLLCKYIQIRTSTLRLKLHSNLYQRPMHACLTKRKGKHLTQQDVTVSARNVPKLAPISPAVFLQSRRHRMLSCGN
ncbi:hypothetical protein AQUCO_00300643v1 [Aquilegia coerulea]|uniref:Uncharacterized protein n=1 Tax=Aquilegia coerulea TaxID=218851 RepID=A0A2G5EZU4_AQUCA|nr:hypothetical protein AQUCO_00300643v1 [Aquilegia coerulea]